MAETVDGVRLLLGARALLMARSAARLQLGREGTAGELTVLRVLGARQIAQAVVTASSGWRALGAGVDVLHATSMLLPLAAAPRRLGRFALLQIGTAAALIALELAADRR